MAQGTDRYRVSGPAVIHETIEGETIVIDLSRGIYYSLEDGATETWVGLLAGLSRDQITARLTRIYPRSANEIPQSVDELLERLEAEGLLVPDSAPLAAPGAAPDAARTAEPAPRPEQARFVLHKLDDLQDLIRIDPIHDVGEAGWPFPPTGAPSEGGSTRTT
jgi:coenzyme PQQ synthesis protein D (PqqD)